MEFSHSFDVAAPVDRVWPLLLDFERIAPCVPGAQLTEVEGNDYRGSVKIRLGPITAQYKGVATLVEVDEAARRMVVVAKARDTHGQGNVGATMVGRIEPAGAGSRIFIDTDLQITGKVAQLGRGVMQDVSSKLLQQFVTALNRDVLGGIAPAEPGAPPELAAAPPAAIEATEATEATEARSSAPLPPPSPPPPPLPADVSSAGPRRIASVEAQPIDLLAMGSAALAPRLWLAAGGVLLMAAAAYLAIRLFG